MWKALFALPALFLASQLPVNAAVIPPGTQIQVRSDSPINVSRWDRGRIYPGHVMEGVFGRDGQMVIRRGAPVDLIIRQVEPGVLALDLESVTTEGRRYVLDAQGPQYSMTQEQYNNGSGLLGTIANAIAGADGQQVVGRGAHVLVPDGSVLTFQLQQPLFVAA
jgi:hypothetical protein